MSDEQRTIISGISTEQVAARGADHTTNGIRMGIDGWIYIAVGDYGFNEAIGTDGRVLRKRGGGVVRVRPDGSDMEIYCWGLRNILDVCVDPELNMFTRDNTNDVVVGTSASLTSFKAVSTATRRNTSTSPTRRFHRWPTTVAVPVAGLCTCTIHAGLLGSARWR